MLDFFPSLSLLKSVFPNLNRIEPLKDDQANRENIIANLIVNLKSAATRWLMLRSLYDRDFVFYVSDKNFNNEDFNFADWHKYITQSITKKKEKFLDLDFKNLLFYNHLSEADYLQQELIESYNLDKRLIDTFFSSKIIISSRTFRNHLKALLELKLLSRTEDKARGKYKKVNDFKIEQFINSSENITNNIEIISNTSLSSIANIFKDPIGNDRRLYLHNDYVVGKNQVDTTEDVAYELKEVWQNNPIVPIKINYDSANLKKKVECIIYPVCLYYYQRALYLCAFGQTPKDKQNANWYNFRLDRISRLEVLSWEIENLPFSRSQLVKSSEFTPEYIVESIESAYGLDFYQPERVMLLRFNADFARRYIDSSSRHETFKRVSIEKIDNMTQQEPMELRKKIKKIIARHPDDSYYRLNYRENDNNVIMRLRAWGNNVEVLAPLALRQRVARDTQETWNFYQND